MQPDSAAPPTPERRSPPNFTAQLDVAKGLLDRAERLLSFEIPTTPDAQIERHLCNAANLAGRAAANVEGALLRQQQLARR